jgi:DNA topoisomerase I
MGISTRLPPPEHSAKQAGLVYINEHGPGIRRVGKSIQSFRYRDASGRLVTNERTLARIRRLAIPPAWADVWICPVENGHLQATGRDARGRKQYRYHPHWREVRDETKFNKMIGFARLLPHIREKVGRDLARPGLPREKVLATVVRLLETGLIRVGNDEYARTNKSYGITTLQDRHARISSGVVEFKFKGKSGKEHSIELADAHLAKIIRKCQALPGQELFQYQDERGKVRDITSTDVNDYLRQIAGQDFTAKDFRTWAGTVLAAIALAELQTDSIPTKKNIKAAIERVAKSLGNTPTICRKCYVHPAILEAYLDGHVIDILQRRADRQLSRNSPRLKPEETAVLKVLKKALGVRRRDQRSSLRDKLTASLRQRARSNLNPAQGGVGGRGIPAAAAASSCKRRRR